MAFLTVDKPVSRFYVFVLGKFHIVDAEGYTLSYGYDKDNRPVSVTDANGSRTGYTYDANGNVTAVANPDGGTEQYVYDLNDCVEEVKRLNGAVELGDAYKYQKREN